MHSEQQHKNPIVDNLLTTVSVLLFLGGFYLAGSLFLAGYAWYVRLAVAIVACLLALLSLSLTTHRNKLISLAKGARIEWHKVFWPSKDEVGKMTLMVLAIVAVFALFLNLIDWILSQFIRWIL